MSISITQTPATASLAQSPIIFTVAESNPLLINSSSFQYIGELYYWTGSIYSSGSSDYTITKYSNTAGVGIFDLNRIIYSTLTDLAQTNQSNITFFAADFYTQFITGSTYVTGSHVKSNLYKALDGYGIFPETIGAALNTLSPYYPLLTDGPVTQSVFVDNKGVSGVYVGNIGETIPTKLVYTSNITSADYAISGSTSSSTQIVSYPIAPTESGFPLSTVGLTNYTIQPYSASVALGAPIRYEVDCLQKYPNVRIKWKNRFGQFDWFNFYMVNKQSFQTTKRTYQPQIGSWESSTFAYNEYDSSNLNYINDSKQSISVNTFWIPETYNDIFKQLLVSDEIYWLYDESNNKLRPLTIATSNIMFKTGVVDKQIQYSFTFNFGQPYKLIM
jgi:hypothetical protein